ncbi:PIN domain-containing protein [Candidatus Micrarchaeota archaeon]|nr:PIN domain-containing protein [Candidatus Micrarchaeota archaeon]
MTKSLVDTNVLIYSVDEREKKKHEVAVALIASLMEEGEFALGAQNLAEFSRVLAEKASPKVPAEDIKKLIAGFMAFAQIFPYNANTMMRALSFSKEYKIAFFDALVAATMEENGIGLIYTENVKDFSKIPFLSVKNPFVR